MPSPVLKATNLCRIFQRGPQKIEAVKDVNLEIAKGEFAALVGASGSGKSTLLNLLAGLDSPTSGEIKVNGNSLDSLTRKDLSSYRANQIGMIFQTFNLLPHRTALENVEMALYFTGTSTSDRRNKSILALEQLGLQDRLDHRPNSLSGGEQQRVAVARALVKEPEIIFADEPTGNLDKENSHQIAELLAELNRNDITIVLVTHDENLAVKYADNIYRMDFGSLAVNGGRFRE
ncbi:MAG: ABC transporter ATP-binding protein [candidate division Zixibacteria bacterium]|nr:ABC transporter ATP-binding protein [candidate division Zixibacteria bacterium]